MKTMPDFFRGVQSSEMLPPKTSWTLVAFDLLISLVLAVVWLYFGIERYVELTQTGSAAYPATLHHLGYTTLLLHFGVRRLIWNIKRCRGKTIKRVPRVYLLAMGGSFLILAFLLVYLSLGDAAAREQGLITAFPHHLWLYIPAAVCLEQVSDGLYLNQRLKKAEPDGDRPSFRKKQ